MDCFFNYLQSYSVEPLILKKNVIFLMVILFEPLFFQKIV